MSALRTLRSTIGMVAGLVCVSLGGCHVPGLTPDTRTPADRAVEMEPRCRGLSAESAAPFLAPSAIDSVEPAYSYVKSGPEDRQARLRGARLHVRPLPGMSRESLARTLECHEVRVVLGRDPAPIDDPYALPGQWLDVDVDSEGDGFTVDVRIDEFGAAQETLARAKRFVGKSSRAP